MIHRIEGCLSPSILRDADMRRIARIVQSIAIALLIALAVNFPSTIANRNWAAMTALVIATPSIAAALWLSRQGRVSTAVFMMALVLLLIITIIATLSQGINDVTVIAYPGILVVCSLVLNKRAFMILTGLTLAAVGWLALGAISGLFVPVPQPASGLTDLIAVLSILIITTFSAYSLADSMQQAMNERHLAEQSLRESQIMLQLIFDHAFDGISVYEEFPEQDDRRLVNCNTRYAKIAGRSKEELLAMGNTLLIQKSVNGPQDRAEFVERLNQGVYTGRFSWLRPDGRDNIIEYTAVPLHLGDRLLVIGVDHDITTQVQAAQEREAMIKELEAKNIELERFTYTVSHDLKSPLITISGFAGFLEKDARAGDVERIKADVTRINDAIARMQRLLDELLELSRIGRRMNPPEEEPFEKIAREAVELVGGRIAARGVEVEIARDLPLVYGDRARLVEVVQNLVDNATKFMGDQPQPRIEIGVQQEADRPVFYVRDNGIGIEPQYQDRIFGLFDKLDPQSEGTGIGLALVRRIVEAHGGNIWIESEGLGRGSTFCFTLADRIPGKAGE